MKDDRTAKILQLLSLAGKAGQSRFPGGRPGLITWLGKQLDAHTGAEGYALVEQRLQHELQKKRRHLSEARSKHLVKVRLSSQSLIPVVSKTGLFLRVGRSSPDFPP